MGAEPFGSGDPATFADLPDDLFGTVGTGPEESEFWTEADQARHSSWVSTARPRRRHRRPAPAALAAVAAAGVGTAASPLAKRTVRGRLAAAWAAESSARRALRFRPAGAPKEPHRGRKIAMAAMAVIALLALGVAAADLLTHERETAGEAERDASAGLAPGGDADAPDASADADVRDTVPSEVVDATRTERPRTTTPTGTPKSNATTPGAKPVTTTPSRPSGATPGTPTPTAPPATATPTTAAPKPATPTTAPPATTAPPPVKPSVQAFTATAATAPGGSCPALQWATTLKWTTTSATSVAITGLLEQPLQSLPGDGSKVVCRVLPGGPLGGWTLTATGAGGTATATA